MPGEIRTIYVPFGELKPDAKFFGNDGLTHALNVVPVYGNYISTQFWAFTGNEPATEPYGIHAHFGGGSAWNLYLGAVTALYEYNTTTWGITDKTRAVGGAYNTAGAGGEAGWQSTSFGDSIIMTQYVDDPQLLTSPTAANFVKLAQSGGANPGMDPKAKFVYSLRGNLHLANLNLPAALLNADGSTDLAAGAHPTTVCWSQTENVRQFGSFNATPQLTGTGFQPLNYDFGHLAGAAGSNTFAILFLQKGIVREDGPPYTFRPIVAGTSCRYPNSIVIFDQDVYFWGPAGPSVLRGGEGPVLVLGEGRVARTLIDNSVSGFSPTYSLSASVLPRHVNVGVDWVSGLVYWSFTSTAGTAAGRLGDLCVIYNTRDDRFSFIDNTSVHASDVVTKNGLLFLDSGPDLGGAWSPGRDLAGVMKWTDEFLVAHYQIARPDYGDIPATLPMQLTRGYEQFDKDATTRVRRIRPILFKSSALTLLTITCNVFSRNGPLDAARQSAGGATADSHGWITFPTSVFADFHLVQLIFDGTALETLVELEGFEVEYEMGGRYSA
jgi:hypothetical protein